MKRLALVLFVTLALVACSRKGPSPTDSPAPTSPASPTVLPTASATPTPSRPPAPRVTIVPSATRLQSAQPTSQSESEGVGASPTGSAESPSTLVPSSTPTPRIIDAGATATLSNSPLPAPSESSATPGASSTPAGDNGTPTASSTPSETTATPTTEAAASSTPTPIASALPTPQGKGWSFENVHTFYDEDYEEFYAWGEIVNNTSSDQHITSLLPVVYEDGEPVTSKESVSAPTDYNQMRNAVSLAPDQGLPFSFRVYLPTGVMVKDNYEILIEAEPSETARDDLDILSDDFDSSDWPYYFYVEGTFENPGPDLSEYVAIFVTVYDKEEHVIGVGGFYQTSSSHLATGTHSFEIEIVPWDVVEYLELDVYSYKVHIFGY